jgi:hypothetical protein
MSIDFSDIKIGDRFLCRGGDTATIINIEEDTLYPVTAIIDKTNDTQYYAPNGMLYYKLGTSQLDLVEKLLKDLKPAEVRKTMNKDEYFDFVETLFKDMQDLMRAKNNDYTADGGPFSNFEGTEDFGVDRMTGLMIRMSDKFQRLKSYSKTGKLLVKDEGIEDAFKDLIGYSCLALGMLKEGDK